MRDIARDVGVSVITVSKVLRNLPDISDSTRKRVLDRVKELNYIPNFAARSLATGRSYLVGLVVPDLLHTFFAQIAVSLSNELLKKGYGLIISTTGEDPKAEEQMLDRLSGRGLDALVIASGASNSLALERLSKSGLPFVLIDRNFSSISANYVGCDHEVIGRLATEHLVEIGCKRIAHLRGPETAPGIGRLNGYLRTLAKYKLKTLPHYISSPRMADVRSRESGLDQMKQMLNLRHCPDGVFAYNDSMAIGAIDAILDAGLRIPQDIAVIGAGNLHYDAELRVPLSSIDQETGLVGERAGRLTISLIEAKTRSRVKCVIIPPKLVIRASTHRK